MKFALVPLVASVLVSPWKTRGCGTGEAAREERATKNDWNRISASLNEREQGCVSIKNYPQTVRIRSFAYKTIINNAFTECEWMRTGRAPLALCSIIYRIGNGVLCAAACGQSHSHGVSAGVQCLYVQCFTRAHLFASFDTRCMHAHVETFFVIVAGDRWFKSKEGLRTNIVRTILFFFVS